ncbi:unnamed protein product, partial [Brenthis ino]
MRKKNVDVIFYELKDAVCATLVIHCSCQKEFIGHFRLTKLGFQQVWVELSPRLPIVRRNTGVRNELKICDAKLTILHVDAFLEGLERNGERLWLLGELAVMATNNSETQQPFSASAGLPPPRRKSFLRPRQPAKQSTSSTALTNDPLWLNAFVLDGERGLSHEEAVKDSQKRGDASHDQQRLIAFIEGYESVVGAGAATYLSGLGDFTDGTGVHHYVTASEPNRQGHFGVLDTMGHRSYETKFAPMISFHTFLADVTATRERRERLDLASYATTTMVRNYRRKSNKGSYCSEKLQEAVRAVQNRTMKKKLVSCLHIMEKNGFGLSREEILNMVGDYVNRNEISTPFKNGIPGKDWLYAFQQRHNLTVKKPQSVDEISKEAFDALKLKRWKEFVTSYDIPQQLPNTSDNYGISHNNHRDIKINRNLKTLQPRTLAIVLDKLNTTNLKLCLLNRIPSNNNTLELGQINKQTTTFQALLLEKVRRGDSTKTVWRKVAPGAEVITRDDVAGQSVSPDNADTESEVSIYPDDGNFDSEIISTKYDMDTQNEDSESEMHDRSLILKSEASPVEGFYLESFIWNGISCCPGIQF